jgi:hypothetical protein
MRRVGPVHVGLRIPVRGRGIRAPQQRSGDQARGERRGNAGSHERTDVSRRDQRAQGAHHAFVFSALDLVSLRSLAMKDDVFRTVHAGPRSQCRSDRAGSPHDHVARVLRPDSPRLQPEPRLQPPSLRPVHDPGGVRGDGVERGRCPDSRAADPVSGRRSRLHGSRATGPRCARSRTGARCSSAGSTRSVASAIGAGDHGITLGTSKRLARFIAKHAVEEPRHRNQTEALPRIRIMLGANLPPDGARGKDISPR